MTSADVIIVGGGPAGSTCAWKLKRKGIDVLLLDHQDFPRSKPCAGWITPRVLANLEIDETQYPHALTRFDRFQIHVRSRTISMPVRQYAIRRIEFDNFLLGRSEVAVQRHKVKRVTRHSGLYILDDLFACTFLVGAGGTHCPVYREVFKPSHPRSREAQIVSLETEFKGDASEQRCHLWFQDPGFVGYSWYVPKRDGYVNIGVGAKAWSLEQPTSALQLSWKVLLDRIRPLSEFGDVPHPSGYSYYLRTGEQTVQIDNAFLVGDAAGLATKDLGEGIGPAVESGIRAADAILHHMPYSIAGIHKHSIWDLIFGR